jgi:hypothetical protein
MAVFDSDDSFRVWSQSWMSLASFAGPSVPDAAYRVDALSRLWDGAVPGTWKRSINDLPARLKLGKPRYSRGNAGLPRNGEHRIESDILSWVPSRLTLLGRTVTDGVNALPLVKNPGRHRQANVEADLILFTESTVGRHGWICEVKHAANNAWYAAVENLRQLKLAHESEWVSQFCENRVGPLAASLNGLVVAPESFYASDGQKRGCLHAVGLLAARLLKDGKPLVQLATWHSARQAVEVYVRCT